MPPSIPVGAIQNLTQSMRLSQRAVKVARPPPREAIFVQRDAPPTPTTVMRSAS
jgi:hypothetical protein